MTDREIVEKFVALVSRCPVGYAHGRVLTHRAFQEQDLIDWLFAMHALREQVQERTS